GEHRDWLVAYAAACERPNMTGAPPKANLGRAPWTSRCPETRAETSALRQLERAPAVDPQPGPLTDEDLAAVALVVGRNAARRGALEDDLPVLDLSASGARHAVDVRRERTVRRDRDPDESGPAPGELSADALEGAAPLPGQAREVGRLERLGRRQRPGGRGGPGAGAPAEKGNARRHDQSSEGLLSHRCCLRCGPRRRIERRPLRLKPRLAPPA